MSLLESTSSALGQAVSLNALSDDPYPTYKRLRDEEPVCWVPAANRYLITRYEDVVQVDRRPEVFSNQEPNSLVIRAMGNTLLRKDGEEHKAQRRPCIAPMRPNVAKTIWRKEFERLVDRLIDDFVDDGEADLYKVFASPCGALSLGIMLGLPNASADDLLEWCQAFIDGSGNYGDDQEIWRRCESANAAVDAALDEAIPYLRRNPDESVLSAMVNAPEPLPLDKIRGNAKVFIGGGINEPRDVIDVGAYALLTHPDQRRDVEADPALWAKLFEETVRRIAPIGMYPRIIAQPVELGGKLLQPGTRVGVVIASAKRDERMFADPDSFNIHRTEMKHLAFGGGPHFCMGAWTARVLVGEVALPALFRRLPGLELDTSEPVRFGGWVFRGTLNMPVRWDPARTLPH